MEAAALSSTGRSFHEIGQKVRALGNLTSLGGQTSWTVHAVAGSSRTAGRCKFLDNQRRFAKLK